MSADWPVMMQDETLLLETQTPRIIYAVLWLVMAMAIYLALITVFSNRMSGSMDAKALVYAAMASAFLPPLALLNIGVARLSVTTHRLAIRRAFGQRFSILYPEITDLDVTAFGLRIMSSRRERPVRLDLIAGAAEVASEIRKRRPA